MAERKARETASCALSACHEPSRHRHFPSRDENQAPSAACWLAVWTPRRAQLAFLLAKAMVVASILGNTGFHTLKYTMDRPKAQPPEGVCRRWLRKIRLGFARRDFRLVFPIWRGRVAKIPERPLWRDYSGQRCQPPWLAVPTATQKAHPGEGVRFFQPPGQAVGVFSTCRPCRGQREPPGRAP